MKKFLLAICSIIMLVGCGNIDGSEITSDIHKSTTKESTTENSDIEQETDMPFEAEIYEDLGGGWVVEREVFTVPTTETVTENLAEKPMPIWSPEYFQYEVTDTGLNIYKTLNVLGERGELHQQLTVDIETPSDNIKMIVIPWDYDGDSYYDIAVRTLVGEDNTFYRYFRYNPDTDYFEEWEELDKLKHFVSKMGDELTVFSKLNETDSEQSVYKWSGDVPVLIKKEKNYMVGGSMYVDYLEYDESGNETLIKRECRVLGENGAVFDIVDVPLT